jgi:hypothetical protein
MVFAEFQKLSTGWNGKDFSGPKEPIPALGSDGVFILDARKSRSNMIEDARKRAELLKPVHSDYIGFKLFVGRTFSDCKPLGNGEMIPL